MSELKTPLEVEQDEAHIFKTTSGIFAIIVLMFAIYAVFKNTETIWVGVACSVAISVAVLCALYASINDTVDLLELQMILYWAKADTGIKQYVCSLNGKVCKRDFVYLKYQYDERSRKKVVSDTYAELGDLCEK